MSVERNKFEIWVQCDDCGAVLDETFEPSAFNAMIEYAKSEGWTYRKDDHHHHNTCPSCKPSSLKSQRELFSL